MTHTFTPLDHRPGLVILNPVAGDGKPDQIRQALSSNFPEDAYRLYETTGEEDLRKVVQQALADGIAWMAAAGGDGTVSAVADGLVNTQTPLAIIPAGTGNALAQEFGLPQDPARACALLAGEMVSQAVDAIKIGDRHFLLQVGAGLESMAMNDTPREQKNQWGKPAYLWTAAKKLFGWQPHRFTLQIDGETHETRAAEVVLANSATIGVFDLKWRETIRPDDGQIDVIAIRSRSIIDFFRILIAFLQNKPQRSPLFQFFPARDSIHLDAKSDLPVHGDGEIISAMPLQATVVPEAINILVPPKTSATGVK